VASINKQFSGSQGASKLVGKISGSSYTHEESKILPVRIVNVRKKKKIT
jgi:hypothetical protein